MSIRHPIVSILLSFVVMTVLFATMLPGIGSIDFVEYWSANRLFWSGQNPYDSALMLELQNQVSEHRDEALMMWNPPWLVPLMSPITCLPYQWALSSWFAFNCLMLFVAVKLLRKTYGISALGVAPVWLATICFLPAMDAISFGQLGILFLFSICSFLFFYDQERFVLAGMCLVPLTVKPHLFLGMFVFLALKSLVRREFRTMAGFLTGVSLLLGVTFLSAPKSIGYWMQSFSITQEQATQPIRWRTATLTNRLRDFLFRYELPLVNADNIVWLVPLCGMLTIAAIFFWNRWKGREADLKTEMPLVLILSFLFAPFAWTFDHAVLLVVPVTILASVHRENRSPAVARTVYVLVFGCLATFFLFRPFSHSQSSYFWISSLMLWLYMIAGIVLRQRKGGLSCGG